MDLPDRVRTSIQDYAAIYRVSAEIHPDDFIFRFIHDDPKRINKEEAVMEYFQSGFVGAKFVKDLIDAHPISTALAAREAAGGPLSLLEFASGYGRVTRHLSRVMPEVEVTACDIHPEAVAFLRGIGFDARLSAHTPDDFDLGRRFDVIYAFSFFTHMPRATWTRWLAVLGRHLKPGGVMVMTTHGRVSQDLMAVRNLEADGFFFHAVSEQGDLSTMEYGNTVTTLDFVYHQLASAGLRLLQFRDSGAGQHDLYIVAPDPSAAAPWGVREGAAEVDRVRFEAEMIIESDRRRARADLLRAEAEAEAVKRRAEAEAAEARRELADLQASRIWRGTEPLRRVVQVLKGRG